MPFLHPHPYSVDTHVHSAAAQVHGVKTLLAFASSTAAHHGLLIELGAVEAALTAMHSFAELQEARAPLPPPPAPPI
eukprot:COSAG01_NODE_2555_length_7461_cov_2.868514_7_plen_77_part_00